MTYRDLIYWKWKWIAWGSSDKRYKEAFDKAQADPEKYKAWWDREICDTYREFHEDKTRFSESFEGLPGPEDSI